MLVYAPGKFAILNQTVSPVSVATKVQLVIAHMAYAKALGDTLASDITNDLDNRVDTVTLA